MFEASINPVLLQTTKPTKELLLLKRNYTPLKDSKKLRKCHRCIEIKNRSKAFSTEQALTWHVTHEHKDDVRYNIVPAKKSSFFPVIKREFEHD